MPKITRLLACVLFVGATCSPALAEDELELDARFVGYNKDILVQSPSAGVSWLALAGLGLVCLGPLFLNANRTHLD